jgi:starch synthase
VSKSLLVVHAASEAVPFAKTGGLADVAGALPLALRASGVRPVVVMPRYRSVAVGRFQLRGTGLRIAVPVAGRTVPADILEGRLADDIPAFFIDQPAYYDRAGLYQEDGKDYWDNAERFFFFSRAVVETVKALGLAPDVIHCHDWQTGLLPLYLDRFYRDAPGLARTATVFTVHNLGYQGIFWSPDMPLTGLPWDVFNPEGIEFYGKINCLKAGLVYADRLTTVSPTYAREIQTAEQGVGLDGILRRRAERLTGILNGIDSSWNPASDGEIPARFNPDDLAGKAACKEALQRECGLRPSPQTPLFAVISRLAEQKGFDLVIGALDDLLEQEIQLVVLGDGDRKYADHLKAAAEHAAGQVSVTLGFDAGLARRIYAGADLFLMPSRYEPCGLGQMISLKYGTVPIVRRTGGLADTVFPFSTERGTGTGFVFEEYHPQAFLIACLKAINLFHEPDLWERLVRNGMRADFSWDASARAYADLYRKAVMDREGAA